MADWEVFRERFKYRLLYKTTPVTLVFGASDLVKSLTLNGNCLLHMIKVVVPNWTNTVTLVLTITDPDGDVIYTSPDPMNNDTSNKLTNLRDYVPIWGECTFTFTLSGVPGGSGGSVVASAYCL